MLAHCRRTFIDAQDSEPEAVAEALKLIGVLYSQERAIAKKKLTAGQARPSARTQPARGGGVLRVVPEQRQRPDLLPRNPLASALHYAAHREAGLRVFLDDPRWPSTPITWNAACVPFPPGGATGCSRGPNSAPNAWASSRV